MYCFDCSFGFILRRWTTSNSFPYCFLISVAFLMTQKHIWLTLLGITILDWLGLHGKILRFFYIGNGESATLDLREHSHWRKDVRAITSNQPQRASTSNQPQTRLPTLPFLTCHNQMEIFYYLETTQCSVMGNILCLHNVLIK